MTGREEREDKGGGEPQQEEIQKAISAALRLLRTQEDGDVEAPVARGTDRGEEFTLQDLHTTLARVLNQLTREDLEVIEKFAVRRSIGLDEYASLHAPGMDPRIISLLLSARTYLSSEGQEMVVTMLRLLNTLSLLTEGQDDQAELQEE